MTRRRAGTRMGATVFDDYVRKFFADTPLYLEAMLDTWIAPRALTREYVEVHSMAEFGIRHEWSITEGPVHPRPHVLRGGEYMHDDTP